MKMNLSLKLKKINRANFALGFLPVFVSFFVFFFVLFPKIKLLNEQKKIVNYRLENIRRLQKEIKIIRSHLQNNEQIPKVDGYLFVGKDPYVIISTVQELLKDVEGLSVRSFRIISQKEFLKDLDDVSLVVVHFNLQGDIKTLVESLEKIFGLEKAIKIKNLTVSRYTKGKKEFLQFNFQLEALFRKQV